MKNTKVVVRSDVLSTGGHVCSLHQKSITGEFCLSSLVIFYSCYLFVQQLIYSDIKGASKSSKL